MKVLNLYECANQLQLPAKWLKHNALAGKIPCLKIGKRDIRFNPEAVQKAIEQLAANGRVESKQTILGGQRRA